MHTILLGRATGGPNRTEDATFGAALALLCSQLPKECKPPFSKNVSSYSENAPETSILPPSPSNTPGFSLPGSPNRISFMLKLSHHRFFADLQRYIITRKSNMPPRVINDPHNSSCG